MYKFAFVYTAGENSDFNRRINCLDRIETEFNLLGVRTYFVAFEDRADVDWKEFCLVVLAPIFLYPRCVEDTLKVHSCGCV
jgi:hypothetical protein